ncbi:carbohydrate-binding module family 13 protein, partial [Rhizoctonia solani AG-3 Rhs1AP]
MSIGLKAGHYRIRNVATNSALDLWGGATEAGTQVQGFGSHDGDNQKWRLQWVGTGNRATLSNVMGGTYIGVSGNIQNCAKVVGSTTAVHFLLVAAGNKSWALLVADRPEYVLDLHGSCSKDETPVGNIVCLITAATE